MRGASPRVLMPSRRLVDPEAAFVNSYELEDVVASIDDVELLPIEPEQPRPLPFEQTLLRQLDLRAGLKVERLPRKSAPAASGQHYDLFFIRVISPDDLDCLDAVPGWRQRCGIAACWVDELWAAWLQHRKWIDKLRQFDHVFLTLSGTAAPLAAAIGRPCTYLAPGIDALRFCPYPNAPPRSIDLFAMGRRSPFSHRRVLEYARKHPEFLYLYDSARAASFVESYREHREHTADLVKRSRFFVVYPAKIDTPEHTAGQQEFGPRFMEGAAGGAVLIGQSPRCAAFETHFDWPDAVIEVAYESPEMIDVMLELRGQPERLARIRRDNIVQTLRRHDWAYRWLQLCETLGLPAPRRAAPRLAELQSRAAAVTSLDRGSSTTSETSA